MSTEEATTTARQEIRTTIRELTQEQYLKTYKAQDLRGQCDELGVDHSEVKSKADIYALIVKDIGVPDPALRGASSADDPVATVWTIADSMFARARADADEGGEEYVAPRRKDVIATCQKAGVAFYTARTQYQSWFTATDRGANRLADMAPADLPKVLQPVTEEAAAADAS